MTLLDQRPTTSPQPAVSGAAGWRGSWRVSLRMARRDVRRHKGRSAIVALMAGLPIALLCFAFTMYATVTLTGAERIPYELGTAVASAQRPQPTQLEQDPDGNVGWTDGSAEPADALPIPGYSTDGDLAASGRAIGALTRGTAIAVGSAWGRVLLPNGNPEVTIGLLDPVARRTPLAQLATGRWPQSSREVVVSTTGASERGLPTSGSMEVLYNGNRTTVTVVGTVTTKTHDQVLLPMPADAPTSSATQWLIERAAPMTWDEVRHLNRYGLVMLSAKVLRNPPPADEVPAVVTSGSTNDAGVWILGAVFLALIVILLTAPAFAVSASRQRRTLALAAANGAEQRQLRRAVLAQGVVLGGLSVALGSVVGVGAAYVVSQVLPVAQSWAGPWDVPWFMILGIAALGLASCVLAAMLPAIRLGRLDVVGVMKGQSVSPPLRRWVAWIGLALSVASAAFLLLAPMDRTNFVTMSPTREMCAAAVVGLCLGALMVVPWLLVTLARHASRFPIALRLAARDTARHRSRSIPTVAATLAAMAAVVATLISISSGNAYAARNYTAQTLPGEAYVSLWGDNPGDSAPIAEITSAITRVAPSLVATTLQVVTDPITMANNSPSATAPTAGEGTAVLLPGCTLEQALTSPANGWDSSHPLPASERCNRYSSGQFGASSALGVLPRDEIVRRMGLNPAQQQQLDRGALVVLGSHLPSTTTVASAPYSFADDGSTTYGKVTTHANVPVIAVDRTDQSAAAATVSVGVLATPQTAAALGWTRFLTPGALLVRDPSGSISRDTESAINNQVTLSSFTVERGYQSPLATPILIIIGVFLALLLVTTLTSTGLAMAEQRADDATMAAVGATRRTRRAMAAGHAYWLGIIATFFGGVAGVVIGQALARLAVGGRMVSLNGEPSDPTVYITTPWLTILAIVVLAPTAAALLAWLAVRRAPQVTRRAT